MSDDEYQVAMAIEDDIVWPLDRASHDIYDAVSGAEISTLDNAEQREYICKQVDEMIYQLNNIKDKLEGN